MNGTSEHSQILIVLAHPRPGSLNHAIAETAADVLRQRGHTVWYHDLYAEGFSPVLTEEDLRSGTVVPHDVASYAKELSRADGIVVVHPNWWGQPPALLKGWIDRVFRPGVAYRFLEGDAGGGVPRGLLRARVALIFNTADTPAHREEKVFTDPLGAVWERCVFRFCGVPTVQRKIYRVVVTSTPEQRQLWLDDVRRTVGIHF